MTKIKGFKTVFFGVLLALLSIFTNEDMAKWVAENLPWVGGGIGTIVVILRALTNSPMFKKD